VEEIGFLVEDPWSCPNQGPVAKIKNRRRWKHQRLGLFLGALRNPGNHPERYKSS
jgi:hypothetical protein